MCNKIFNHKKGSLKKCKKKLQTLSKLSPKIENPPPHIPQQFQPLSKLEWGVWYKDVPNVPNIPLVPCHPIIPSLPIIPSHLIVPSCPIITSCPIIRSCLIIPSRQIIPSHPIIPSCPIVPSHPIIHSCLIIPSRLIVLTSDGCKVGYPTQPCNHHWSLQGLSTRNPSKEFVKGHCPEI